MTILSNITQQSSVGTDTSAFDRIMRFGLHKKLFFDQAATVQPTNVTHRGSSVTFNITTNMTEATSTLTEGSDLTTGAALADTTAVGTLGEYGNAVQTTAKLRGTSYMDELLRALVAIGKNAGQSLDTLAYTTLVGATATGSIIYSGTATSRAITSANFSGALARQAVANLRRSYADPLANDLYVAFTHPNVSYDLSGDSATFQWFNPAAYSDADRIWNGFIGRFAGAMFVESASVTSQGTGSGAVNAYQTLFVGNEALGKVFSQTEGNGPQPVVVESPVTDTFRRFVGYGWYWLGAYLIVRNAAVVRVESVSSLG